MTDLLKYLDGLSPFLQGLLGSAAVVFIVWLGRHMLYGARQSSRRLFKFFSKDVFIKHVLYKEFVRSNLPQNVINGNFFVINRALHWAINAAVIIVFMFTVSSLLEGKWFHFFGFYFALNSLVEANSWLKDRSDEKHIAYIDQETKKELIEKFYPKRSSIMKTAVTDQPLNQDTSPADDAPVS